jgi:lipopolysaccharide biosynthesis regulator YciM
MPGGFGMQAMALFVTVTIPLGIAALMGWLGGRPGAMRGRKKRETPSDYVAGENTGAPVSER